MTSACATAAASVCAASVSATACGSTAATVSAAVFAAYACAAAIVAFVSAVTFSPAPPPLPPSAPPSSLLLSAPPPCTHCFPEPTHSHLFGSGYMQTSVLVMCCFYPTAGGTTLTPNRTVLWQICGLINTLHGRRTVAAHSYKRELSTFRSTQSLY